MVEISIRGLSLTLGLGFLIGAFWGPTIQIDALLGAVALLFRAFASSHKLEKVWASLLLVEGIGAMLLHAWTLISVYRNNVELIGQLSVLATGITLLAFNLVRSGKELWSRLRIP